MPLLRADSRPDKTFLFSGAILGTCFSLGGNLMMTAGHVVRGIANGVVSATIGLVNQTPLRVKAANIIDVEELSFDLAVFAVDFVFPDSSKWFYTFPWSTSPRSMLEEVRSVGYPYGVHNIDDKISLLQRGFQGHIVSLPSEFKPLNYEGPPFPAYELSFAAPVGLSGSPLFTVSDTPHVLGIIIGNSKARMLILESEEVEKTPATTRVVEQYESLSLGIAVPGRHLLNLRSRLLGGTFAEYLQKNSLLL